MNFLKTIGIGLLALPACTPAQRPVSQANTLPSGVVMALAADEKAFCDQFEDKKYCHRTFPPTSLGSKSR